MDTSVSSKAIQKARQMAKRNRTSVACMGCKSAKARCSEYRPCKKCSRSGEECVDLHSPSLDRQACRSEQVCHQRPNLDMKLPGLFTSGLSFWNSSIAAIQPSTATNQDIASPSYTLHTSTQASSLLQDAIESQHETYRNRFQNVLFNRLGFLQQYDNPATYPVRLPALLTTAFHDCTSHSFPSTVAPPNHFLSAFPTPPPIDILQLLRRP
jgi:hypothetical protein